MDHRGTRLRSTLGVLLGLLLLAGFVTAAPASAGGTRGRGERALPVVFVHGGSGSAAQYETQALRWASNGYPNVVRAIDRTSATAEVIQPILDEFFDRVMDETGDEQIYVVAHSQGVAVMNAYLDSSPARAARVARYIGIDSASGPSPDRCPGGLDDAGRWVVPCMGVWGRGDPARRFGPDRNVQFADQGHVQVVGSAESFTAQYRFLAGRDPRTTDIVAEPRGRVEIAGRALNYPANTALTGAVVQLWKVDEATGTRRTRRPAAQFDIGEDGNWGPVRVDGRQRYELVVIRQSPDGPRYQHFYYEPFTRSNHLIRLNVSPFDSPLSQLVARGPGHSMVSVVRQKEWWGDNPVDSDTLLMSTARAAGGTGSPPVNIVNGVTAPAAGAAIGIITFDDGADGVSHPDQLIPRLGAFLTGVDVFYPAASPPDGTITLDLDQRLLAGRQVIRTPNWASTDHAVTATFRDWAPADDGGHGCPGHGEGRCRS